MDDQQISIMAADLARAKTLQALARAKVTQSRWAKKISKLLDAKITKVFNDKDSGLLYSEDLEDNATQAKMVELLAAIYGAKATEKHDHSVHGDIAILLKEIEGTSLGPPSLRGKAGKP